MQCIQRTANDAIADSREPAGPAGALLIHVKTQHFDEQHLGKLREHSFPARTR